MSERERGCVLPAASRFPFPVFVATVSGRVVVIRVAINRRRWILIVACWLVLLNCPTARDRPALQSASCGGRRLTELVVGVTSLHDGQTTGCDLEQCRPGRRRVFTYSSYGCPGSRSNAPHAGLFLLIGRHGRPSFSAGRRLLLLLLLLMLLCFVT